MVCLYVFLIDKINENKHYVLDLAKQRKENYHVNNR